MMPSDSPENILMFPIEMAIWAVFKNLKSYFPPLKVNIQPSYGTVIIFFPIFSR